ncbi:iron ABC transporter permease [Lentilactobacillus sp. Marseille-Q4993]|uniref:FecCD family ABC transporter permease n=1 Tax=Lentilactobacillus sp. Marseille-Q4993 TaxID=3039492 RepID=UPI0024BCF39A|nr:iron ABC transporter permease [Lentilactobacillus sp. Marseille-Q4993]
MKKRERLSYVGILVLLVITIAISLILGAQTISFKQLISGISGGSSTEMNVIMAVRVPRIIVTLISGGMLAVAGALSQSVFRNRLADPSILGVASGAELAILLGAFILPGLAVGKIIFAIIGGIVALLLLMTKDNLRTPYRLIIVGVALNIVFVGITQLFSNGTSGSSSSFNGVTWNEAWLVMVVGLISLLMAVILSPWANYLKLSDDKLATIGLSVITIRVTLLTVIILLTSGVASVVGTIPFIGIIVPNLGRSLVGRDYQTLVPFSMLSGAWLLLLVDTVGRLVVLPSEISAATIMTVAGGIFLIWLIQRGKLNEINQR